jgi:SagB-type dehydrogenase family enzyme
MDTISLPPIPIDGPALTTVLGMRRSRRAFSGEALTPEEVSLLLWAAHGVTSEDGRRTAPSAGFTDPSVIVAATPAWVGRYLGEHHHVEVGRGDDIRPELAAVAGGQDAVGSAGLVVGIAARVARTAERYGDRAERYVTLEAGHIAQNVLLAAESAGLWAVPVGAFDDTAVARILGLDDGEVPRYLVPVGRPT